jgi:DNA-binding Lrp family transcriptional regulator
MRLSTRDSRILACAQMQTRAPLSAIASQAGCRPHIVARCLERLRREEVITPFTQINVYRLGLTDHAVFFSIAHATGQALQQLLRRVQRAPFVSWLQQLGGEYQYVLSVVAGSAAELEDSLEKIFWKSGVQCLRREIATRVDWVLYRHRYLYPGKCAVEELPNGGYLDHSPIDELDLRILAAVGEMPTLSFARLAQLLDLKPSTFDYRIHRLEKRGVIVGYGYYIDVTKLGMFPYYLLLFESGGGHVFKQELRSFCGSHPYISSCDHCLGSWSYELAVRVPNPLEVQTICQQLMDRFGRTIVEIRPLPVWSVLKFSPYPGQLKQPGTAKLLRAAAEGAA